MLFKAVGQRIKGGFRIMADRRSGGQTPFFAQELAKGMTKRVTVKESVEVAPQNANAVSPHYAKTKGFPGVCLQKRLAFAVLAGNSALAMVNFIACNRKWRVCQRGQGDPPCLPQNLLAGEYGVYGQK